MHTDHRRARPSHKRPRNRRRDKTGQPKPLPETSEDAAAAIGYTSGTAGRPKGAYFTHRTLTLHTPTSALILASHRGHARPNAQRSHAPSSSFPMFHAHGCWVAVQNSWGKGN
ncbi:MAG: AMP-binding protein [Pyrobaculum sp.]